MSDFNMSATILNRFDVRLRNLAEFARYATDGNEPNGIYEPVREALTSITGSQNDDFEAIYVDTVFAAVEHLGDLLEGINDLFGNRKSPASISALTRVLAESSMNLIYLLSEGCDSKDRMCRMIARDAHRLREEHYSLDDGSGVEAIHRATVALGLLEPETPPSLEAVQIAVGTYPKPTNLVARIKNDIPARWTKIIDRSYSFGSFSVHARALGAIIFYPKSEDGTLVRGKFELREEIAAEMLVAPVALSWWALELYARSIAPELRSTIALDVSSEVREWMDLVTPIVTRESSGD